MPGSFDSPGSSSSPWYQLIGLNAIYIHAGFTFDIEQTWADVCMLINTPTSPLAPLEGYSTHDAWSYTPPDSRCDEEVSQGISLPIPDDFVIEDTHPSTPNYPTAHVDDDGVSVYEYQPFTRCIAASNITMFDGTLQAPYNFLTSEGEWDGSHGGSGAPALFGTIREADAWFTKGPEDDLGHVLKFEAEAEVFYDPDSGPGGGVGYRWPATKADSCAPGCYGSSGSPISGVQPGALLAIRPADLVAVRDSMETTVAKVLVNTAYRYGMRIVDSTSYPAYAFCTAKGPTEDVVADFETAVGEPMLCDDNTATPWGRDVIRLVTALYVVSNDSQATPGGGGAPLPSEGSIGGGLLDPLGDWSICGITLPFDEIPIDGSQLNFTRKQIYVRAQPYNSIGTLKQNVGTEGYEIKLHLLLSRETKDLINAEYVAQGATGTRTGLFVCPEPPYDTGVRVKITEFTAEFTASNRGLPWFDCEITMEESPELV